MTILIADAGISVAVQLSDAIHTLAGGVAFALPVLAFLALTKLLLSRTRTAPVKENPECAPAASIPNAHTPTPGTAPVPATHGTSSTTPPAAPAARTTPTLAAAPAAVIPAPSDPVPTGQLLISARMAAFSHQQQTGTPITSGELATRMNLPPALAESLLDHVHAGETPPPVTAVNGTVLNGSRP